MGEGSDIQCNLFESNAICPWPFALIPHGAAPVDRKPHVHVPNVAAVRLAAIHWPASSWKGGTTEREARSTGTGTSTVIN